MRRRGLRVAQASAGYPDRLTHLAVADGDVRASNADAGGYPALADVQPNTRVEF